jgi:hypothetical protein
MTAVQEKTAATADTHQGQATDLVRSDS